MHRITGTMLLVVLTFVLNCSAQSASATAIQAPHVSLPGTQRSQPPVPPPTNGKVGPGHRPERLDPPKIGVRIKNPRASQQNPEIIAVLARQKQVTEQEFRDMKVASNKLASSPQSAAPNAGKLGAVSTARPSLGNTPERTESAIPANIARAPQLGIVPCVFSNRTMSIGTIAGAVQGAILSADPQFNLYTIQGCNLGDPNPNNRAYVYGKNGFHLDLQIQYWSQNSVAVNFDPAVRGFPDMSPVFLVLHRADGQQTEKAGLKFYAARETNFLNNLPKLKVQFAPPVDYFGNLLNIPITLDYVSPQDRGTTARAQRWGGWEFQMKLGGADQYDLSTMQPGFQLDSFQLNTYSGCGFHPSLKDAYMGTWGASVDPNSNSTIDVTWEITACEYNHWNSVSTYDLLVWVSGPRGVDPWTGKAIP